MGNFFFCFSGVAQLSCTDCSASCSGSSSSASELTDPGSPYSTSSSHGEDSNNSIPSPISKLKENSQTKSNKMPPHESSNHSTSPPPNSTPSLTRQPWPWDKITTSSPKQENDSNNKESERGESPPNLLKRVTATKSTHINSKRLKTDIIKLNNNNNTRKLGKSLCPILPKPQGSFQNLLTNLNSPTLPTSNANPPPQHRNKQNTTLSLLGGTKQPRGVNNLTSEETGSNNQQQGKITEYFKSQVKPTSIKKGCNTKPKNYVGMLTTTVKSNNLEKHFYNKNGIINCDNSNNLTNKIDVRTLTFQSQFHNKTIKLDAKLNGKVSPVVSLARKILPKSLITTAKVQTLQTGMPTCVTAKSQVASSESKSVKSDLSVVVSEPISGSKISDSTSALQISINTSPMLNSLVLPSLVNGCSDSSLVSLESQKSPILSQPKVIRFPARKIVVTQEEPRLDGKCFWTECTSKFETSGALLEHLQVSIFYFQILFHPIFLFI